MPRKEVNEYHIEIQQKRKMKYCCCYFVLLNKIFYQVIHSLGILHTIYKKEWKLLTRISKYFGSLTLKKKIQSFLKVFETCYNPLQIWQWVIQKRILQTRAPRELELFALCSEAQNMIRYSARKNWLFEVIFLAKKIQTQFKYFWTL